MVTVKSFLVPQKSPRTKKERYTHEMVVSSKEDTIPMVCKWSNAFKMFSSRLRVGWELTTRNLGQFEPLLFLQGKLHIANRQKYTLSKRCVQ